ncbi:hypothetical protein [Streptococcus suis]|uniref:hypothetical protein n=1 Tax=Streptococcus suis TaxID=1307 RepID=UPI00240EDF01|nr:hypothetical protein [Streptococcus suis]MDG3136289.1 hypothetical protein [Streptococcus suis]
MKKIKQWLDLAYNFFKKAIKRNISKKCCIVFLQNSIEALQNIAIEPIYQKETEYKICCFFGSKSRSGGIEKKILEAGNESS